MDRGDVALDTVLMCYFTNYSKFKFSVCKSIIYKIRNGLLARRRYKAKENLIDISISGNEANRII